MAGEGNEMVYRVGAEIDASVDRALGLMDSLSNKTLDFASSVSESAGALGDFSSQIKAAEQNLTRLKNNKDATRKTAMILAGAFAAATTAIYRFVKSTFDAELGLEKMAKKQKKSTDAIRAQENALKAMGKTLQEVKADKELNKTYKELVKINEEMALPNLSKPIEGLKKLRVGFWELRATAKNVIDWIGARVLTQIQGPINRITDKLKSVSQWLRNNLDSVSMKISSYLTGFIKGVEGVVNGFTKVIGLVNQIDPAIRKVGTAIMFVMGLIKAGPIGQILTLLTLIGGVIDDLDNYKYNKKHGLTPENVGENAKVIDGERYEYVPVALTGIFDVGIDENGHINYSGIGEKILEGLTDAMAGFWGSEDAQGKIGEIFGGENGDGGLIGSITTWLSDHSDGFAKLGQALVGFIAGSIRSIGGSAGGFIGQFLNLLFGDGTATNVISEGGAGGATMFGGLAVGIGTFIKNLGTDKSFLRIVGESAGTGFLGSLVSSILSNTHIETDTDGGIKIDWEGVKGNLEAVGQTVVTLITKGLDTVHGLTSTVFQTIGKMLISPEDGTSLGDLIGNAFLSVGNSQALSAAFGDGLMTWLATGNFGMGLLGGIIGSIVQAASDPNGLAELKQGIEHFWNGWEEAIEGSSETRKHKGFKESFLDIVLGQEENGKRSGGIWDTIQPIFSEILNAIGGFAESIWNGTSEFPGLSKTFSKLWERVSSSISEWWNGKAQYDEKGFKLNETEGGFRKTLHNLIFGGENDSFDPFGLISGFNRLWNGPNGNDGLWATVQNAVTDFWEGRVSDESTGAREGGLKALLFGENWENFGDELGEGSVFKSIIDAFRDLFSDIAELAEEAGSSVWRAFFNSLPGNIRDMLTGAVGVENPNSSHLEYDNEGNAYIVSDSGNKRKVNYENLQRIGQLLPFMDVAGNGRILFTGKYTGMENDSTYGAEMSAYMDAFLNSGNEDALKTIKRIVSKWGWTQDTSEESEQEAEGADRFNTRRREKRYSETGKSVFATKPPSDEQEANEAEVNLKPQTEEYDEKIKEIEAAENESKVDVNAEDHVTEAIDAIIEANSGKSIGISVEVEGGGGGGSGGGDKKSGGRVVKRVKKALGGRVGKELNNVTIGEDGPEYVIPISKPNRATQLIKQMFGEMGTSAVQRVIGDMNLGIGANTIGSDYASIASAMGTPSSVTNNNSVQAPVNIYVQASGVGAEDVGERAYDAAQRHMLRTLKGVFA